MARLGAAPAVTSYPSPMTRGGARRDRSWGIRPVGEREAGRQSGPFQFYWLWAPLNFDDACYLFDVNEHGNGSRWHESAMHAPAGVTRRRHRHGPGRIQVPPAFGHAPRRRRPSCRSTSPGGNATIQLTPLYNFYMQGIGYTHPTWGHGMYVGDDVRAYDSVVTADEDEASPLNLHVQAVCRAERDDGAAGTGILEQLIVGPSATLGLNELFDMAP